MLKSNLNIKVSLRNSRKKTFCKEKKIAELVFSLTEVTAQSKRKEVLFLGVATMEELFEEILLELKRQNKVLSDMNNRINDYLNRWKQSNSKISKDSDHFTNQTLCSLAPALRVM